MAQKAAGGDAITGGSVFRALIDLVILALLVCGAAFGGYWYGIHERLAPINAVAPGTPGALPPAAVTSAPTEPAKSATTSPTPAANTTTATTAPAATKKGKLKFWLTSSGTDYVGYSINVNVNDNPVDGFFGPGKSIDVTRFVKPGDNVVTFEAKQLGEKYNKHKGDKKSELEVKLVSGPAITEDFKSSAVLATFQRTAADTEEGIETMHFTDGD